MVIASCSLDNVLAITGFGIVLGFVFTGDTTLYYRIAKGPLEIVLGISVGLVLGYSIRVVPLDDIDHAKLVPDWDAVMAGKSGAGGKQPNPVKPGHRPSQKQQKHQKQKH